jgi:conjugative transposon TraN protein
MKQIFFMLAFLAGIVAVNAQGEASSGDLYNGFTRSLTFERMIPPYGLEVTFAKTVHIIFPAAIRYVDLGSVDLLAAKADGAENVLRVKAARQGFQGESNLSVITEDGIYYAFNVKYVNEPVILSIEMANPQHRGKAVDKPGPTVYLSGLGTESPQLINRIMESIYRENRQKIKHLGSKLFGVQYLLKSIYTHNDRLFFHLALKNSSSLSFEIDGVAFRIVDKKLAKRTAMQEQVILPVRTFNELTTVAGNREARTVFVLPEFTLPDGKELIIELREKDGGRNQSFAVENSDLIHAGVINNLEMISK